MSHLNQRRAFLRLGLGGFASLTLPGILRLQSLAGPKMVRATRRKKRPR